MSKNETVEIEVDTDAVMAFLGGALITIALVYFLIMVPLGKQKLIEQQVWDCQNITGKKCAYYCWRPPKEGCLALPNKLNVTQAALLDKVGAK